MGCFCRQPRDYHIQEILFTKKRFFLPKKKKIIKKKMRPTEIFFYFASQSLFFFFDCTHWTLLSHNKSHATQYFVSICSCFLWMIFEVNDKVRQNLVDIFFFRNPDKWQIRVLILIMARYFFLKRWRNYFSEWILAIVKLTDLTAASPNKVIELFSQKTNIQSSCFVSNREFLQYFWK